MGARGQVAALLAHAAVHARAVAVALARCRAGGEQDTRSAETLLILNAQTFRRDRRVLANHEAQL